MKLLLILILMSYAQSVDRQRLKCNNSFDRRCIYSLKSDSGIITSMICTSLEPAIAPYQDAVDLTRDDVVLLNDVIPLPEEFTFNTVVKGAGFHPYDVG